VKIALSWLKEHCPVELSPEELEELLSAKGIHVESIDRPWAGLSGVVVARVLEVRDHPNSAKLCLARVSHGSGERELVVGVRNMKAGDLVSLAGPGARLPTLAEPLSAREIRGVVSEGMLCSPHELGISPDHSSILILPPDTPEGADVKQELGLDEVVLDLEIETNRPDLLSVVGVAREVAAATGVPLALPEGEVVEADQPAEDAAWVKVDDPEKCPRYLARVILNVVVGPSPIRVQARLTASGMRPVSNVVDATNYAMLEVGHPMHPFDVDRLDGGGVIVRRAGAGERLVTLDGVERMLTGDDLVIADRSKAVGIAGVMGSADGEVSSSTTNVLLESAYFEPRGVFRTSRRLVLQTEASARFSRGADPEALASAADRAARLMLEWARGVVLAGAIDVGRAPPRRLIAVRPARASLVTGHEISAADVAEALGRLGMHTEKANGAVQVEVPSFRPDLQQEIDVIEEVLRVHGYENVGSTVPETGQVGSLSSADVLRRRIREALVRAGLREALSLSFASGTDLEVMGHEDAVRMANPPSGDERFLRSSLLPGLLRALARNLDRGMPGAALFEVGHVFRLGRAGQDRVEEREFVAATLSGPAGEGVHAERRELDALDGKGALEALLDGLAVSDWSLGDPVGTPFHPARSVAVIVSGTQAGVLGEIDPGVAERLGLAGRIAVFELDVTMLPLRTGVIRPFRGIPRYPPVRRDLAFVVDEGIPAGPVRDEVFAAGGELVERVVLFDVFSGAPIPAGKKSLAFSVDFRAPDRTLTDEEAEEEVRRIVGRLGSRFGAELRSGSRR
jgi:phenylalanyl-tRNA synthetase beta chain